MASIVPTILTADKEEFTKQFATYAQFAKRIQIDLTDGEFTVNKTITLDDIPEFPESVSVDLHMMVLRPSEHVEKLIARKPSLVIFHAEAAENLLPIFEQLKAAGIRVGVAMVKTTFPGRITPYLSASDHALIFAGALGLQGGKADLLQEEKTKLLKNINPNLEIGWDGGANIKNVRELARAGIDVINVGSAFSKAEDPAKVYQELSAETEARGVSLL